MPTWILPVSLVIVGGGLRRGGRGHVGLQRGEGFPLNWLAPDPGRQERDHSHRHLHRPRVDKAFLARPGAPCSSHTATASLSEAIALAAVDLLAGIAAKAGHAGGVNCVFAESITRSRFPC